MVGDDSCRFGLVSEVYTTVIYETNLRSRGYPWRALSNLRVLRVLVSQGQNTHRTSAVVASILKKYFRTHISVIETIATLAALKYPYARRSSVISDAFFNVHFTLNTQVKFQNKNGI